jgi:hypothetical protein
LSCEKDQKRQHDHHNEHRKPYSLPFGMVSINGNAKLSLQGIHQAHVNAPGALHLTFGGETLVESFGAKLAGQL